MTTLSTIPLNHVFQSGNELQYRVTEKEGITVFNLDRPVKIITVVKLQETTSGLYQWVPADYKPKDLKLKLGETKDKDGRIVKRLLTV